MSDELHIELTWTCSSCKYKNLGRYMTCQGCGNPKDDSEEYEMPGDPSKSDAVTDPKLLEMARAGANWRCAYCGSNQRDLHGGCMQCGAGRKEGANQRPAAAAAPMMPARQTPSSRFGPAHVILVMLVSFGLLGTCGALMVSRTRREPPRRPTPTIVTSTPPVIPAYVDVEAEVAAVEWERVITIERWQLVAREGFTEDVPAGAVDVTPAGQRVHHHEDVFDHDETIYEEVEVPDGFKTESYTERVRCGEDCKTTPRTCRKVCTRSSRVCHRECKNKQNGFASCREVCTGGHETCRDDCTGGDRKCSPKYCDEHRTRHIPKTKKERRAKIVKKYRSEPRYAPWSTYKEWDWVAVRTEKESGEDIDPRWPDAGKVKVSTDAEAPKGGDEREVRTEKTTVTFKTPDGKTYDFTPASDEELDTLAPGTKVVVRIEYGKVKLLGLADGGT